VGTGVLLWVPGWFCGYQGASVGTRVLLWVPGWFCGCRGGSVGLKWLEYEVSHLHCVVLRGRKHGALPLLASYAFMVCTGEVLLSTTQIP
jgi:hypothetical protein